MTIHLHFCHIGFPDNTRKSPTEGIPLDAVRFLMSKSRQEIHHMLKPSVRWSLWVIVHNGNDRKVVPLGTDECRLIASHITDAEVQCGFCARLSRPGFACVTEWLGPYKTEKEAWAALVDACPERFLFEIKLDDDASCTAIFHAATEACAQAVCEIVRARGGPFQTEQSCVFGHFSDGVDALEVLDGFALGSP